MNTENTAIEIAKFNDDFYDRHNLTCRPYGKLHAQEIAEIVQRIANTDHILENLNSEVIDLLTDWNYHTAAKAAKFVFEAMT